MRGDRETLQDKIASFMTNAIGDVSAPRIPRHKLEEWLADAIELESERDEARKKLQRARTFLEAVRDKCDQVLGEVSRAE